MSKRVNKRLRETSNEYESHRSKSTLDQILQDRADAQLFVVDRCGATSGSRRRKLQKEEIDVSRGNFVSKYEAKIVSKLQKKRNYTDSIITSKGQQTAQSKISFECADLWAEDQLRNASTGAEPAKRALVVCAPGLSYNPNSKDHQRAVAEAVAVEIKAQRDKSSKSEVPFVDSGLSLGLVLDDGNHPKKDDEDADDDEDEDEDVDEDDDGGDDDKEETSIGHASAAKSRRKAQRLTKAQKNKLRNRRIEAYAQGQKKEEQQLLHTIDSDLPSLCRELEQQEAETQLRRSLRLHVMEQRANEQRQTLKRLTYEEAATVPLSEELSGSLRAVVPKGIPLQLQQVAMRKSGDAADPRRRNRRAYEKPHASKRVVWIPKYKTKDML